MFAILCLLAAGLENYSGTKITYYLQLLLDAMIHFNL
jgi:hypothetical protein